MAFMGCQPVAPPQPTPLARRPLGPTPHCSYGCFEGAWEYLFLFNQGHVDLAAPMWAAVQHWHLCLHSCIGILFVMLCFEAQLETPRWDSNSTNIGKRLG
jgi:hypothetical protein